jgi:4-hydroxyproline epimerase
MSLTKPRFDHNPANLFDAVERIHIVDSHTGGEPTRIIVSGGPDLGRGSVAEQLECFRRDYDYLRSALANEPRGSEVVVGGILCQPADPASAAGVIFFNNVGYLGMCVHGTIGLVITLAYLGKITYGDHRIETPVGTVTATLHETGEVTVVNVASKRTAEKVTVQVPGYGAVTGDVAWGGNWFFLVDSTRVELNSANIEKLTEFAWAIRQALATSGITGSDGKEIDHVELFRPSREPGIQSQNFVLCPGKAYDRSPCGTGTSAKLACLYADGKLKPGEVWRQESIVGSVFEGQVRIEDGQVLPIIKGSAFITSEADVILDPRDPFRNGIYP